MFFLAWKLPSQLAALCQCVRLPGDRVGPAVASDSAVAPSLESVQSKRFASNDAIADLAVQPATDAGVSDNGAPKTHDYKLGTAQVFQNDPLPDDESSSHERTKPFLPKRMVKCKDQYPIRRKPRIPTNSLGDVSFDPSPIQNKGYLYELATRSTPDRYPELVKPAVANTNGSGSQMPGYVSVGPLEATETSGFKPACPKRNWDFYKVEQSSSHSLYELCAHGNNDFDVLERGRPCHRRDHTGKSGAPENGVEAGETMMQGSCGGDLDTAVKPEEVLCEEKRSPSKKRAREDMKFEEAERKMTNGLRKRDEHNKRTEGEHAHHHHHPFSGRS